MSKENLEQLNKLQHVVAIGGGHGLGRVMSSLSFLHSKLTGIVATTDNGGSTGRIRLYEGGIGWGDIRNCINQLVAEPSIASTMFEYRFSGHGELSGHNLGNLMLKALDNMSVRPLDAINLIRTLLKVNANLLPMSEQPSDLAAISDKGELIHGEVNVDLLEKMPQTLMLIPQVTPTQEAIEAIQQADLILIGPGSFMTSIMPPLLLDGIALAISKNSSPVIFIDNLGKEMNKASAALTLVQRLVRLEERLGHQRIDAILVSTTAETENVTDRLIIQQPLSAQDIAYRHDRELLQQAIEHALYQLAAIA